MRGRRPKPAALRELEGNPGHREIIDSPQPPAVLPKPPAHLSKAAKKLWKHIGPQFAALAARGKRRV